MKSIKGLREQYELITEKEDKEQRKLTTLVRAGLFDAKKLPMLKRALDKGADKMTPAEKKILIDLLDSLMNQVISNEPVYMKVKRNIQSTNEEIVAEAVRTPATIADVPSIVVLKRKAVRVYPGGQQVGLYYSQQLDKYVTIPFGEAGIAEETNLEETKKSNKRFSTFGYTDKTDDEDDNESKSDRQSRIMRKKYTDMTRSQRKEVTPGKVFTGHIGRGGSVVDAAIMGLMARHFKKKLGNTYSPSARKKMIKQSLNRITSDKLADAKVERQQRSKRKPSFSPTTNTSKSPYKKSAAASGTMMSRMEESYKPKYKLVRKHQIDEAGPLAAIPFIAGAIARSAAGRAIGGALASGAKNLATKGSKLWRRGKALSRLNRMKGKRKGRRDYDLDVNMGSAQQGSGGNSSSDQSWKTPSLKSDRGWGPEVNLKVGPQYSRSNVDAPVDPATARRLQKQFYTKESTEIDLNGNIFTINSNIAEKFTTVYNSLNEDNQRKMIDMMMNEETQNKVLEFVTRY